MNREYRRPLSYRVSADDDGFKLRSVLRGRMGLSKRLVSRLKLTEEGLLVNGTRAYTNRILREGDLVEIRMEVEAAADILPQDLPLNVLYEDEHLLIADKPAGMVVHPTTGHYMNTLANAVVHHWRERGESFRFRPVHRLDRETSGVLAVAKNAFIHQQFAMQMAQGRVDKIYLAITNGVPASDKGTITGPIARLPGDPHRRAIVPGGAPSVTHFKVIAKTQAHALLKLRLESGRTHQIRVHLESIGCPVAGDKLYGKDDIGGDLEGLPSDEYAVHQDDARKPRKVCRCEQGAGLERQALHAYRLGFRHPATGKALVFTSPLPEDLTRWLTMHMGDGWQAAAAAKDMIADEL